MSAAVRQRARIARVRKLQHGLAAAAATRATAEADRMEETAARLAQVRDGLPVEAVSGAALASLGELRGRLDTARAGLAMPIAAARRVAAAKEDKRQAARRDQEAAERLHADARAAADEAAERRLAGTWRQARRRTDGEEI